MPTKKKTPVSKFGNYYVLGIQLGKDGNLWGIPGDQGILIDALKMHNMLPSRKDQLLRLYKLMPWTGTTFFECKCGLRFISEQMKNSHGRRRHQKEVRVVKDLSECDEE